MEITSKNAVVNDYSSYTKNEPDYTLNRSGKEKMSNNTSDTFVFSQIDEFDMGSPSSIKSSSAGNKFTAMTVFAMRNNLNSAEENQKVSTEEDENGQRNKELIKLGRFPKYKAPVSIVPPRPIPSDTQCDPTASLYHLDKNQKEGNDSTSKSYVYVTAQNGTNFQLHFIPTEAEMEPLFICPRKSRPLNNEKKTQVVGHYEYYNTLDYDGSKLFNVHPEFVVDPKLDAPSKCSHPPLKVYTSLPATAPSESISRPKKSTTIGFMNINIGDITLKIRVKPMPITKIKLPVTDDVKTTMERLNMPSTEKMINRAQMLVRNKNDLLRISFNLTEVVLSRLPERKTQANQAASKVVTRSEYNSIGMKRVNLNIPESTYVYKDPMVDIKRLNDQFARMNIHPLWKYQLFQKRVSESRGGGSVEEQLQKLIKKSRGSLLVFEGFNAVATAVGGLFCGRIAKGHVQYEDKMYAYLGEDVPGQDEPELQNANSSSKLSLTENAN